MGLGKMLLGQGEKGTLEIQASQPQMSFGVVRSGGQNFLKQPFSLVDLAKRQVEVGQFVL